MANRTQPRTGLSYEEVTRKVNAFDEWYRNQPEDIRFIIDDHRTTLTEAMPNMGDHSAKLLLAEIYLHTRRHILIERKYGKP